MKIIYQTQLKPLNWSSGMLLLIQLASMTSQHSFSTFWKTPRTKKLLQIIRWQEIRYLQLALISETGQGEWSRNLLPWGGGTQQGIFQPISNVQRSEKKKNMLFGSCHYRLRICACQDGFSVSSSSSSCNLTSECTDPALSHLPALTARTNTARLRQDGVMGWKAMV